METINIPVAKELLIQGIRFTYPSCRVLDLDKIMASYGDKDCNGSMPKKATHANKSKENCELILATLKKDIKAEDNRIIAAEKKAKADAKAKETKRLSETERFAKLGKKARDEEKETKKDIPKAKAAPKKATKSKSTE